MEGGKAGMTEYGREDWKEDATVDTVFVKREVIGALDALVLQS